MLFFCISTADVFDFSFKHAAINAGNSLQDTESKERRTHEILTRLQLDTHADKKYDKLGDKTLVLRFTI